MKTTTKPWILFLLLPFLLLSCTNPMEVQSSSSATEVSLVTPEYTDTIQPTKVLTQQPSASQTPAFLPTTDASILHPTWTPLPTLSPEKASQLVAELLETNGGCELPCWWGITPGETSWNVAFQFLSRLSIYIGVTKVKDQIVFASAKIPVPYPVAYAQYLMHDYSIEYGIVDAIRIYNFDLAPNYYLSRVLQIYGQPEGIWIRTFREEEQSRPFLIDIFYSDKGILLEYGGGDIKDMGDYLVNCLDERRTPYIYLWAPDKETTFEDATKRYLYTEDVSPVPLQDATGMSVSAFYEKFISQGKVCLETPKDLWP
jgi:hypothetical protein